MLFPFIIMTYIYSNRRNVRKRKWIVAAGTLTEEFSQKTILQLYFVPVWLFQRLAFSAIIVLVYSYPLIQLAGIAICNLSMAAFLIIVRPYKLENQQTSTVVDELILFVCLIIFAYLYMN